ncbi:MAG: pyridoxal 5'-phosphate synthase glutaminase subunit PdxT [Dehalococcoidia bacterium]|nr:pyridoxal 5'-phosphate synthase glutaminase subunit PdxT [Dehalococcoidia bacterium]
MKVGVLAVQGDFAEHIAILKQLGVDTVEVRLPGDLDGVDALVMPGGESTTFSYLMDLYNLREPIVEAASGGTPIWGTCAGMIMMARELTEKFPEPLGLMDIGVARNAFGRQVDSFETDLRFSPLGDDSYRAIFIRAPGIVRLGDDVQVLAQLSDGRPVAVRQGSLFATSFHPELGDDPRIHQYFLTFAAQGTN